MSHNFSSLVLATHSIFERRKETVSVLIIFFSNLGVKNLVCTQILRVKFSKIKLSDKQSLGSGANKKKSEEVTLEITPTLFLSHKIIIKS